MGPKDPSFHPITRRPLLGPGGQPCVRFGEDKVWGDDVAFLAPANHSETYPHVCAEVGRERRLVLSLQHRTDHASGPPSPPLEAMNFGSPSGLGLWGEMGRRELASSGRESGFQGICSAVSSGLAPPTRCRAPLVAISQASAGPVPPVCYVPSRPVPVLPTASDGEAGLFENAFLARDLAVFFTEAWQTEVTQSEHSSCAWPPRRERAPVAMDPGTILAIVTTSANVIRLINSLAASARGHQPYDRLHELADRLKAVQRVAKQLQDIDAANDAEFPSVSWAIQDCTDFLESYKFGSRDKSKFRNGMQQFKLGTYDSIKLEEIHKRLDRALNTLTVFRDSLPEKYVYSPTTPRASRPSPTFTNFHPSPLIHRRSTWISETQPIQDNGKGKSVSIAPERTLTGSTYVSQNGNSPRLDAHTQWHSSNPWKPRTTSQSVSAPPSAYGDANAIPEEQEYENGTYTQGISSTPAAVPSPDPASTAVFDTRFFQEEGGPSTAPHFYLSEPALSYTASETRDDHLTTSSMTYSCGQVAMYVHTQLLGPSRSLILTHQP
jgi:hypothetical protein